MKFFIVGLHASGKQEILDILEKQGVNVGRLFSNIESASPQIYNSYNYELMSTSDINEMFENRAYLFLQELESSATTKAYKYYEGLSLWTYDNNQVFALSPDQFIAIPQRSYRNEELVIVWVDNDRHDRNSRYIIEKRAYSFKEREEIENRDISVFGKSVYSLPNSHVIYFANEDPGRVACSVLTLIEHPEYLPIYEKYFD